ncbi:MAG: DNA topoisomerase, partial [Eubacteriales bacterium]|nr:DNA topoisomerase [Eubacteriales bacterium]
VYASRGRVQDAHEAIRPTSVLRTPSSVRRYLSDEQYKLYELVWSRFVASQMASALFDQIRVDIQAGAYLFRATGSTLRFPGFLKVYIDDREEDKDDSPNGLPAMEIGDILKLARSLPKQHFTQPPPRYTEAALVRSLEELGIGRPSTYAPVVETVQRRGYVVRRGKNLHPTELGTVVDELLNEHFPDVINVEFTAEMEEKLDQVEEGGVDWVRVLEDFYQPFRQEVARAEEVIGRLKLEDEVTDEICVQCGRNMVIKMGRYGKFLACPGFPECRNARPITQETGHRCPKCDGNVVVRKTRKGKDFFGCDAYPKCDFVSWDPPIDEKCPTCGTFLVEKAAKKSKTVYCPHPNCDYKEKKAIGE